MTRNMNEALAKLEPQLRPDQKTKLAALRATMAQGRGRASGMRGGTVWVLRDKKPVPIAVRVGASDGSSTEILSRDLKAGDRIIVGGGPRPKADVRSFGGPPGGGGGVRVKM
jgi:HlyD family secretion protein